MDEDQRRSRRICWHESDAGRLVRAYWWFLHRSSCCHLSRGAQHCRTLGALKPHDRGTDAVSGQTGAPKTGAAA